MQVNLNDEMQCMKQQVPSRRRDSSKAFYTSLYAFGVAAAYVETVV